MALEARAVGVGEETEPPPVFRLEGRNSGSEISSEGWLQGPSITVATPPWTG